MSKMHIYGRTLLTSTFLALGVGGLAFGQQTAAPSTDQAASEPQLEEVVVTGSLLKRADAETAEAVTIVTTDSLKDQGITTVEQALQQISATMASGPGAYSTQSSVATFTGGASTANLRGLGRGETLVLLDGQRLANNVQLGNAVDLNVIPFAAIDHIEVLREGASSLYGSDAIAGVINFITKKDYDKGEVNVNFSKPQQSGGGGDNADLTWGKGNLKSDGYNLLVSLSYNRINELRASQRSFAATGFNPPLGLENQNGPVGTFPGSYLDHNNNVWQVGYPACTGNPELTRFFNDCAYLYSAVVDLIPKSQSESGLVTFTKALGDNNTLAAQYFYSRNQISTWTGPQTYGFEMTPAADPNYFPTAANSTCSGGPGFCTTGTPDLTDPIIAGWTDPNNNRYLQFTNVEQRLLLTFAGQNGGWDYATSFNFSINHGRQDVLGGEADYSLIAPGGILSNLINPFGAQSAAGQALIDSAYRNGEYVAGDIKLWSLNGHAIHELGDAFGAGRPAQVAVGFDARVESISFATTPLAQTLESALYFPLQDVVGSRNSQAVYAELNVPVTKHFEFTISDREDRYSDFGNTNNSKFSLRYQPFSFLTFRGAASTGFRAPSLFDLFQPDVFGADAGVMSGPGCASGNYNAVFTQSNCTAQGLSLQGGNRSLGPESSTNIDLGFIVNPIEDLGITVDYYHIALKDEIQNIPDTAIYANPTTFASDYVLNNAGTLTQAPFLAASCPPPLTYNSPTCGYILDTVQNTGGITTSGFDVSANYLLRSSIGKFRIGLEGTLVTKYLFQEYQGGPDLNLVSQFNSGNQPAIRWQHILTVDWSTMNEMWGAGISNHYLTSYVDEFPNAAHEQISVPSYSIYNGYVSWKPVVPLSLVLGVQNLLNTDPPFSNQTQNWQAGYNPLFSDPSGRTFYVRAKVQF